MKILGLGIALQMVVIVGAMFFLSWRDAISRGKFLASSNEKSIGLLLATGDLLQLKNLASSFKSEYVTRVLFVDANDENILESVVDHDDSLSQFKSHFFTITTDYPIKYNDRILGRLVLWNRIAVEDWLYICLIWLFSAVILLFILTRRIKEFALSIGTSVESVVSIFDNDGNAESSQASQKFLETHTLAIHIQDILKKLIENARLEKEATVGRLISQISHDLRAPLGAFEQLMLSEPGSKVGIYQPSVRESLNRLHSMIESLRQSEVEVLIKRQRTHVHFEHGFESLAYKAAERHIILHAPPKLQCLLLLDGTKFERSWINLLSNAIDASKFEVRMEVQVIDRDLFLRIIDDGPGVPEDFVSRLFQRGATHGKPDGTGLGLAYVRQIMRGHGGDITYRRESNMTVFECYLPNAVVEMSREDVQNAQEPVAISKVSQLKQPEMKQVSICFISHELNQRVFERLSVLSQSSYTFVLGPSQNSSIVLTDSAELADQLPDTKVRPVLMSSMADDEIVRRAPIRLGIKG